MRDAQSLLDQIISFSGQEVVDEDVRDVLGFIPGEILDQTVDALVTSDSRALLNNIGIVIDQGLNIQQYVREFIGRIRDLLLMRLDLGDKVLGSDEEKAALKQRSAQFSEQDLIRYFDMLLKLESGSGGLHGTAAVPSGGPGFVKLAKVGHVRDIEEVLGELRQGTAGSSSSTAPAIAPIRTRPPETPLRTPSAPAPPPIKAPPIKLSAPKPSAPPAALPVAAKPSGGFREDFIRRVEDRAATTAVCVKKAERIERTGDLIEITLGECHVPRHCPRR